MTLEILICTYNNRIEEVANVLMPPMHNITYLISWQQSDDFAVPEIPDALHREDVKISVIKGKGLSTNRNNAIACATGDICLIGDDDLTYIPNHVMHIVEIFESHPTIDIATFKYDSRNNPKQYPSYSFDLRQPVKGYYVASVEIAFRRKAIQGVVQFNPLFGLNAPVLISGEEQVFIHDALSKGLSGFFFPYVIARHDHATTGDKCDSDPRHVMSTAAYIHIAYKDGTAPLRYWLLAWRSCNKNPLKFFTMLRHVMQGVKYIKRNYIPETGEINPQAKLNT